MDLDKREIIGRVAVFGEVDLLWLKEARNPSISLLCRRLGVDFVNYCLFALRWVPNRWLGDPMMMRPTRRLEPKLPHHVLPHPPFRLFWL